MIGCFGYLIQSFAGFLSPNLEVYTALLSVSILGRFLDGVLFKAINSRVPKWRYDQVRNSSTHLSSNFGVDTRIGDQSVNGVKRGYQTSKSEIKFCMISQNKDLFI